MYLLTLFTCLEINDSIREIDILLVIRENILESIINFVGTDSKKNVPISQNVCLWTLFAQKILYLK